MISLNTRRISLAVDPVNFDAENDSIYNYGAESIDPAKAALVIIDPWASHPNDGWAARAVANMQSHLVPLIAACRAAGIRIVYAPTNYPIHSSVAPQAGDTVISTPGSNTDDVALDQALLSWGVDTVLYAGYASNMCVLDKPAGVRQLSRIRAGRRFIFVRDASIGFEIPETLAAQTLHQAAVFDFEFMFGPTTTVAQFPGVSVPAIPQGVILDLPGSSFSDRSQMSYFAHQDRDWET